MRRAQPFRTKWTLKTEEKLRFYLVNRNPFARNGRWTSKTEEKLRVYLVNRNPSTSHEMHVGRQNTWSIVTLSHEMDVGRQKLRKIAMDAFVCVKVSVCKSLSV